MSIEVYPVVHVSDQSQALRQTEVAMKASADGVFLIDHGARSPERSADIFNAVLTEFPEKYVGVNFLQLGSSYDTFHFLMELYKKNDLLRYPDGIWVDDATYDAHKTIELRDRSPDLQAIQLLGGVAFKYTRYFTEDPEYSAYIAQKMMRYVDVVTTSGAGTGIPPTAQKITAMKRAIGHRPLAVASGIDENNIFDYVGYLDIVLNATSVETHPYSGEFDKDKLVSFIQTAHSL